MRVPAGTAAALARLLAWDAPFLPAVVSAVPAGGGAVAIECDGAGAPLSEVAGWPRSRRLAVAVQLVAAAEFLHERGWLPARSLLRGARVQRRGDGDALRLAALPRWRLDSPRLAHRLRAAAGNGGGVRAAALAPLLRALAPERRALVDEALRESRDGALAEGLLAALAGDSRSAAVLRHPGGPGRFLWARRLPVPDGVAWVEDDDALAAGLAAGRLRFAAAGSAAVACGGALDEGEIARIVARAAAGGRDAVVLTTVPLQGSVAAAVVGGETGVWALGADAAAARRHVAAAVERSGGRAALVADLLRGGAAAAFAGEPGEGAASGGTERLASPAAHGALRWLRQAAVGLEEAELARLHDGDVAAALAELERLRLVARRGRRWTALAPATAPDPARAATMAAALPEGSWAACVAAGVATGAWEPLAARCERALAAGDGEGVLAAVPSPPPTAALALAAAEAALLTGRAGDAERLLSAAPDGTARRRALEAWWAEQAGLPGLSPGPLGAAELEALPPRLAVRVLHAEADAARRGGDPGRALRSLEEAAALAGGGVPEAEIRLAAARGSAALSRLARLRWRSWPPDARARALHLLGYERMERGALAAAATALRAAARLASGADLRLLGDIHSDLGSAAILADDPVAADRYLRAAERLLERCGSRRAVTVVRHNRGVLANDRLDWRTAEAMVGASRELRGGVIDSAYWLEELELARSLLARGAVDALSRRLPALREGLAPHADHAVLREALAALAAHLALARGDPASADALAPAAGEAEERLLAAVVRAAEGVEPDPGLPPRWGMALTARALAHVRRGDEAGARAVLADALVRQPREAAVAFARLAAVLGGFGTRLGAAWSKLRRRAEAALAEAELDGWLEVIRAWLGVDAELVLDRLAAAAAGGRDGLDAATLAPLARALGVPGLEVWRRGERLAAAGAAGGAGREVAAGEARVVVGGSPDGVALAAARLLAALAGAAAAGTPDLAAGAAAAAGGILGDSPAVAALRDEVARWGPLPATVLILGEPGTGKELVARELHRASGRRGRFVPVNCAGIPATLLEAELFGVVRGAYTGADRDRHGMVEEAEHGTLFLDEIGELPLELQAKLLRLLQEREVRRVGGAAVRAVDVRFVAATNRDLKAAMAAGAFRADLFYRLTVGVIAIPPLRERREDIDALARHFLAQHAAAFSRPGVRLSPAALEALRAGRWPGNVRELDAALARAVAVAAPGEVIGASRFADVERAAGVEPTLLTWAAAVEAFRRDYFARMLRSTGGNRSEAARRAGLSRQALLYHLRNLGTLE